MAGETEALRSAPQPGGREPAPGRLALVQAFINSHYDLELEHGAELLHSPGALVRWLAARGLIDPGIPAGGRALERALVVRESLRALAAANSGAARGWDTSAVAALNDAARGARAELRFDRLGEATFVAGERAGVSGALGVLLGTTAIAIADGSWARLKVCPGMDCGWAFYDHSRNQAGRWCSMNVCGARAKARAHYHRSRGGD